MSADAQPGAHAKGTGGLDYPDLDQRHLRERIARDEIEKVAGAVARLHLAWDRYHRAALHGHGGDLYTRVSDAKSDIHRTLIHARNVWLAMAAESTAPVIHETPEATT